MHSHSVLDLWTLAVHAAPEARARADAAPTAILLPEASSPLHDLFPAQVVCAFATAGKLSLCWSQISLANRLQMGLCFSFCQDPSSPKLLLPVHSPLLSPDSCHVHLVLSCGVEESSMLKGRQSRKLRELLMTSHNPASRGIPIYQMRLSGIPINQVHVSDTTRQI